MADERDQSLLILTTDIVVAHVTNNHVAVGDLASLIGNVHNALSGLGEIAITPEPDLKPAVTVRASVKPDHIVCLEDGKKLKLLKRHLRTDHDFSPKEYRAKWSLPKDYPMVAPNYAEARRGLALKIGLGRKKAATPAPAKPARKPRAAKPAAPIAKSAAAPARKAPRRRAKASAVT